jgi:hypothetical protein
MEKRKRKPINWHPDPKVRAMQEELQQWMEKRDLADDATWYTGEEHYGDELPKRDEPACLVLTYDGELYSVLYFRPPDHPAYPEYVKLREEFDEIVNRHGYWFDFEDHVTVVFMVEGNG